jgi:nucleotide-binding universal stress UspA family protein
MIDRILVPLDGSPEAEGVLPWLRSWDLGRSTVILFHCLATRLPKDEHPGRSRFERPEEAQEYLDSVARSIPGSAETVVRSGSPGDRIVTAALQAEADLVVMGFTQDYGTPRTLGKVAAKVATTCPQPVLLVKTPVGPLFRRVRRILLPLDMHARGDENLDVPRSIARDLRAEILMLHIGPPDQEPPAEGPGAADAQLKRMREVWGLLRDRLPASDVRLNLIRQVWSLLKEGIAARTIMTSGSFVEETLSHERSLDADIVALPKGGLSADLPWQAIVRRGERAVLLYEPREAASLPLSPVVRDRQVSLPSA